MVTDPQQLRAIPDPVARVRAVNDAIAQVTALRTELAAVSREAVQEMRRTMSLAEVAAALGVSRGRVQQLEKPPR